MGAAGKHLSSDTYHQCHGLVGDTGFDLMAGLNNLGGLFQLQWFYDQLHLSCEAWWWRSQCKGYNAVCLPNIMKWHVGFLCYSWEWE